MRYDVSTQTKGPVHEFQVQFHPTSRSIHLIGFDVDCAVGEQSLIKPLNKSVTGTGG